MGDELFQGGVLMHSYLRAVGFSKITKRSSIEQIIMDVVETYDEKYVVEDHQDGIFAEFSKNYGCDCRLQSADSMMKTISSMWITISRFSAAQGLPRRRTW